MARVKASLLFQGKARSGLFQFISQNQGFFRTINSLFPFSVNMSTGDKGTRPKSNTTSEDSDGEGGAKVSQGKTPPSTQDAGTSPSDGADGGKKAKRSTNLEDSPSISEAQMPMRYATRGKILNEQQKHVQEEQEKIFKMKLPEKRKLYLCKSKYTELQDVPAWPEYYGEVLASDTLMERWWKANKKNIVSEVRGDLNKKISLWRGDITTLEIDAIVNAANESLLGGGGVDGAIHRAAGKNLLMECELLNGCVNGNAKITCGYNLPAKNVIHTVGPRGEKPKILEKCYKKSLNLLRDNELKSIAFPCISTGIFGYPNLNAAKIALGTIRNWLENEEYAPKVERIIFCLFLEKDVNIYNEQMQLFFPLQS